MARTSFFSRFLALAAMALMLSALAGCGNDNPADSGGAMTVDIRGITQQVGAGGGFSTMDTGVEDSPAETKVESLVIGAVVITFTNTPLTSDTQITDDIENKLADDIINSINYFTIVDLPTSKDFVEFKVPPPGAGKWQVAAVGTRKKIVTFQDLDDDNVGIYYGFTPQFFTTSGSSGPDVTIEMKRACFIDDPPKGCAQIIDDNDSAVTASVEILNVTDQNGSPIGALTYPMYVKDSGGTHTPATAKTALNGLNLSGVTKVTIEVTHQDANGQSAACQTVSGTGAGQVTSLRNNCGSSTFVTEL